jgi:hypothetical protein
LVIATLLILLPYAFFGSLLFVVYLGKAMSIKDSDLKLLFCPGEASNPVPAQGDRIEIENPIVISMQEMAGMSSHRTSTKVEANPGFKSVKRASELLGAPVQARSSIYQSGLLKIKGAFQNSTMTDAISNQNFQSSVKSGESGTSGSTPVYIEHVAFGYERIAISKGYPSEKESGKLASIASQLTPSMQNSKSKYKSKQTLALAPLVARVGLNGAESYRRMKRGDFDRLEDVFDDADVHHVAQVPDVVGIEKPLEVDHTLHALKSWMLLEGDDLPEDSLKASITTNVNVSVSVKDDASSTKSEELLVAYSKRFCVVRSIFIFVFEDEDENVSTQIPCTFTNIRP